MAATESIRGTAKMPIGFRVEEATTENFPVVNPPSLKQSKADDRGRGIKSNQPADHAAALAAGDAMLNIPRPRPGTDVAASKHYHTGGSGGAPGECSATCVCGVTFDGFDTIAEAGALLDRHIANPGVELPEDTDTEAWQDSHPVAVGDDRPSWMTYPERAWCSGGHKESDHAEDRGCVRDVLKELPLRRMDPIRASYYDKPEPAHLALELRQMPDVADPHVVLSVVVAGHRGTVLAGDRVSEVRQVLLTLGEAVDLAFKLAQHAAWGEQPPPLTPAPEGSASWQWTACPAWSDCAHSDDDGEGDQFHTSPLATAKIVKVDRSLEAVQFSDYAKVPYIEVSLRQDAYTAESVVELSNGSSAFANLLTGEARMLATALAMLPSLVEAGA